MADARGLHCPNCGAAAEPEAGRCPFCRGRLATVACPSCFALVFDGAAFCPSCGVRRSRAEGAPAEGSACPGCGNVFLAVALGGITLLECAACDGVWVAADAFERLCADREAQAAVLHRDAGQSQRPGKAERSVRYRPCPQCGKMMNRVNFGRISGAVVDVCRAHGTFLDSGELQQIAAFIRDGGLERARGRQIEDLRLEQAKLREAEVRANAARGQADPHRTLGIDTTITELLGWFRRE